MTSKLQDVADAIQAVQTVHGPNYEMMARAAMGAMKPRSRAWPKARIAHLKALNATGMTFAEIGEEMGLTRSAVSGALHRLGIVGGSRFAQDRRSYSVGAMG